MRNNAEFLFDLSWEIEVYSECVNMAVSNGENDFYSFYRLELLEYIEEVMGER